MHDLLRLYARQLSDTYAEADEREQARDRLLDFYLEMRTQRMIICGRCPAQRFPRTSPAAMMPWHGWMQNGPT